MLFAACSTGARTRDGIKSTGRQLSLESGPSYRGEEECREKKREREPAYAVKPRRELQRWVRARQHWGRGPAQLRARQSPTPPAAPPPLFTQRIGNRCLPAPGFKRPRSARHHAMGGQAWTLKGPQAAPQSLFHEATGQEGGSLLFVDTDCLAAGAEGKGRLHNATTPFLYASFTHTIPPRRTRTTAKLFLCVAGNAIAAIAR